VDNFRISEIKARADIQDVWAALSGGKLRANRGQAFWRGGTGYNVALYPSTGTWHDFVSGAGGDVVELVRSVRACDFREALEWLADFTGVSKASRNMTSFPRDPDTDWPTDLEWATYWKIAAEALAEQALRELPPWDLERRDLTKLLTTIRLGDAALVNEYRAWRERQPVMTTAMARAGQRSDARLQKRLALWLRRRYSNAR
jgi:hypothetical protein